MRGFRVFIIVSWVFFFVEINRIFLKMLFWMLKFVSFFYIGGFGLARMGCRCGCVDSFLRFFG